MKTFKEEIIDVLDKEIPSIPETAKLSDEFEGYLADSIISILLKWAEGKEYNMVEEKDEDNYFKSYERFGYEKMKEDLIDYLKASKGRK